MKTKPNVKRVNETFGSLGQKSELITAPRQFNTPWQRGLQCAGGWLPLATRVTSPPTAPRPATIFFNEFPGASCWDSAPPAIVTQL
jgi:hypothetical protein